MLYAFASPSTLYYVGKTTRTLANRMYEYARGDANLRTNKKCHDRITALLSRHEVQAVDILVFSPAETHLYWGKFRINVAAGLEDSLILQLAPSWNGSNRGLVQTESAATEEALVGAADPFPSSAVTALAAKPVTFTIDLAGEVYWNGGFINPPVECHGLIGKPGEPIALYVEGVSQPLARKIKRANQKKEYPRIYGGRELAQWFQQNFKRGEFVTVEIRSPNELRLRKNHSSASGSAGTADSSP